MMKTVCASSKCTGCRACEAKCPKNAIHFIDKKDVVYAEIDESICVHCELCEQVCINHNPIETHTPLLWKQGWAADDEIRRSSSSGGIAAALTISFIKKGGFVCSCLFENGQFTFHITNDLAVAQVFAGSKYVKSNPLNVYNEIAQLLLNEKKVLFIGLPCQVAALRNYLHKEKTNLLYCVDLICHGTPSYELFKSYLDQHSVFIDDLQKVFFRRKGSMGLNIKSVAPAGIVDCYSISFLKGLNYTEGCYSCQFASTSRVSDVTLGDNWGTERVEELRNGISLVLCNTEKGKELLNSADVDLFDVDVDKACAVNRQLIKPSGVPPKRKYFFDRLKCGDSYDKLVFSLYPKQCFKQRVKYILIKMKIIRRGV